MIRCIPGAPGISDGAGSSCWPASPCSAACPSWPARSRSSVPKLTPRQLESRILGSQRLSFSGYAESDANFGLPALPAFSSVTPLLDGVTRMRVWQASPDRWRVDTLSDAGENDTYQAGANTFIWDSGEQLLTGIYGAQVVRLPRAADLVPPALAVRIISEAGPGAKLEPPAAAAGRRAERGRAGDHAGQPAVHDRAGRHLGLAGIRAAAAAWRSSTAARPSRPWKRSSFRSGPWTPDAGVLTPQRGPGTGFTTTTPSDFSGVLKNLDDEVLPGSLAGFARQPSPVPQIGVYGSGLTAFAVLTFRRGIGGQLLSDALDAGAAPLTLPTTEPARSRARRLSTSSSSTRTRSPDTFLLVGLVSKAALSGRRAAVAGRPEPGSGSG